MFVDERCVPLDHADSNFKAWQDSFFSKVAIPAANILCIEGWEDPGKCAQDYESRLQSFLSGSAIDIAILGMGPDGHTASLFPMHPLLDVPSERVIVSISDSPKPPPNRITFTLGAISACKKVIVVLRMLISYIDPAHSITLFRHYL